MSLIHATEATLGFDDKSTFDDWLEAGRMLAKGHTALHWTLGDWVIIGEDRWQDRWLEAAAAVGVPYATIASAVAVAKEFPAADRHNALSWSHHREAMRAPDDPHTWLDQAEAEGWSARHLAERIGIAKALAKGQDELPAMPPKPLFDAGLAARLMATGVTRVIVDLTTGGVEPCAN